MKLNAILFAIFFAGSLTLVSCGSQATEATEETTVEEATPTAEEAPAVAAESLVGTWVEVAADGTETGFTLNADGTFAYVNVADKQADKWMLEGGELKMSAPATEGAEPAVSSCTVVSVDATTLKVNEGGVEKTYTKKM